MIPFLLEMLRKILALDPLSFCISSNLHDCLTVSNKSQEGEGERDRERKRAGFRLKNDQPSS